MIELKPKGSRTVLAPLTKSNPNATPRSKIDTADKPKALTSKIAVKSSILQTPKPVKKAIPKSTKKTINVYTPARPKGDNEVEYSHPKPPGQLIPSLLWDKANDQDSRMDHLPPSGTLCLPRPRLWKMIYRLHLKNQYGKTISG